MNLRDVGTKKIKKTNGEGRRKRGKEERKM
jgi:hypothetical protein